MSLALAPMLAGQTPDAAAALKGAIDIHVHGAPDDRPRSVDVIQAAREARDRGMRAIVIKNHYESTAGDAYLARTLVPGIEVFGGIDLNLTVGGINPAAVEHMTKVTGGWGRVVWFPTFDSENQVRAAKENRPFVSVARNGALLPAVVEVIGLIAKHNLVLATGHSTAAEGLLLLREGRRQGVQRMVVTHAMNAPIAMTVAQMKEAATLGAFLEFVGSTPVSPDAGERYDRFAAAIRADWPAVLHPVVGSRPGDQSAAGGRLWRVPRGDAGPRIHGAGHRPDDAAEPGPPARSALTYASRLVDRSVASVRTTRPHASSAAACGQSTSMPTPFRKMPRRMTRK